MRKHNEPFTNQPFVEKEYALKTIAELKQKNNPGFASVIAAGEALVTAIDKYHKVCVEIQSPGWQDLQLLDDVKSAGLEYEQSLQLFKTEQAKNTHKSICNFFNKWCWKQINENEWINENEMQIKEQYSQKIMTNLLHVI